MNLRKMVYIVLLPLILSSCNSPNIQDRISVNSYSELKGQTEYTSFDLPNTGGYSYNVVMNSKSAYIPVVYDKFSTYVERMDIFEYNLETGQLEKIYESDETKPFFIDEIFATENKLVWCTIYEDGSDWSMNMMDLTTHELSTVRDYDSSGSISSPSPVLTNDYLAWYELYERNDIYNDNSLLVYNLNTDKINVVDSGVYRSTAYARPSVSSNEVLFLKQNDSEYLNFHVLNLSTGTENIYFSEQKDIVDYSYSNGQLLFRTDYNESNIYYYDIPQDELIFLDNNTAITTIMDIGFFHGVPWILYSRDTDGISNLYLIDTSSDEKWCITENNEQVVYVAPKDTVNGILSLLYYDMQDELHYCAIEYLHSIQ